MPLSVEKKDELVLETFTQFELGTSFKGNINLTADITRSVNFENGKQWNMDDDIEEFPKITLNVIKQIGTVRKSSIMQNEYAYLINSTNFKSVRKIQDFLKYLAQVIRMKEKDLKALKDDYNKGTAIGYFYWDAEKRGFMRRSGGDLRYEIIDVRRVVIANEYIQNIQDQEYIIYNSRERKNSLLKKYDPKGERGLKIVPDGSKYTTETETESARIDDDQELVNVYTKFYRNEDGEVLFHIQTETELLKEPTFMNPWYEGDTKEQPNTTALQDEKADKEESDGLSDEAPDKRSKYAWNLYPLVRLVLNERDNCFFGLPLTLEYIESQKSINNHFSIYDKALQDNVLGGYMFRKGAIGDQELTTENSQMIEIDALPNENIGNALQRMPVANVPADSRGYSQELMASIKAVAGASNVQLGQSDYSGQSGKQTQMLLDRAKENSSELATIFNEFKKDQAYIMFLFAKFYYDNESFSVIEHGFKKDKQTLYTGKDAFNGTEYLDDNVLIDIRVGAAPSFSEYNNMEVAGLMVQSGQLPFEAYLAMAPDGYISNREELIEILGNNSNKVIEQMKQQMEQMDKVMQQMAKAFEETKKDRANIDTVVAENERLKTMLADTAAKAIKRNQELSQKQLETNKDMANLAKIAAKQKNV